MLLEKEKYFFFSCFAQALDLLKRYNGPVTNLLVKTKAPKPHINAYT